MTFTTKTLAATTAALIALSAPAFAAGHEFDVNSARLDMTLDTNGDAEVDMDEIIDGNMMVFDTDGNGALDADERGFAEQAIMSGAVVALDENGRMIEGGMAAVDVDTNNDFDVEAARLDVANDLDGDGEVSNEEIIRANEMAFDVNGDGTLDAEEQGLAEQLLENS